VGGNTAAFVNAAAQLGATADQIAAAWAVLSGSPITARDVVAVVGNGQFANYGWDANGGLISKPASVPAPQVKQYGSIKATDQQLKGWYASVGGNTDAFVKAAAKFAATADQIAAAWTILSGSPTTARDVVAVVGKGQFAGYGWDSNGTLISKKASAQ